MLGAGVPAQSFAGKVGQSGVEPLGVRDHDSPVSVHCGGAAHGWGGFVPAGRWSPGSGTTWHQLIVDDVTDIPRHFEVLFEADQIEVERSRWGCVGRDVLRWSAPASALNG